MSQHRLLLRLWTDDMQVLVLSTRFGPNAIFFRTCQRIRQKDSRELCSISPGSNQIASFLMQNASLTHAGFRGFLEENYGLRRSLPYHLKIWGAWFSLWVQVALNVSPSRLHTP